MKIISCIEEFKKERSLIKESVGFVPTMGALHKGHASLIKHSVAENKFTAVSIFVNPKQFNDISDYETYPKTLDEDLALCEDVGAAIVFLPRAEKIYSVGDSIKITESNVSIKYEGEMRPGHFDGVLLILTKLLNLVKANTIYMGEKDYQQALLTKKLCTELFFDTKVKMIKTLRDETGLPLSSRNSKLTESGLKVAKKIAKEFHSVAGLEFTKKNEIDLDYIGKLGEKIVMAHRVEGVRILDNKDILK